MFTSSLTRTPVAIMMLTARRVVASSTRWRLMEGGFRLGIAAAWRSEFRSRSSSLRGRARGKVLEIGSRNGKSFQGSHSWLW